MSCKEINILSWEQALELIPKKNLSANKEIVEILTEVSKILKADNDDYVYHLKLEYGDKVIDRGKTFLNKNRLISEKDIHISGSTYHKTKMDFIDDILYCDDPLGIVLTNQVEVFTDNQSKGGSSSCSYTVPLNVIESGDLFGVFGLLDYFTGISANGSNREWYARAGIISYTIAFPFHNAYETDLLECRTRFSHLSGKDNHEEDTPGDNKVEFVNEHLKDWSADIAYIPKHFFEKVPKQLKLKALNKIYEIGWEQSKPLRDTMFEDTTIFNLITNQRSKKFKHEINFLNILHEYLSNAHNGNALVMKPLVDEESTIVKALDNFMDKNWNYFSTKKFKVPLPFVFGKINNEQDWGLTSIYQIPIIYNYEIQSLNVLLKDIESINHSIDGKRTIKNQYKIPELKGFGNTGGYDFVKVEKTSFVRRMIADAFQVTEDKVSLNSKEFSNLLLIKNGNK